MATSGSIGGVTFRVQQIIDAAYRRCKIAPQTVTGEKLYNAMGELQRMLQSLPVGVLPLWTKEQVLLGMKPGRPTVTLPAGSIDIVGDAYIRSHTAISSGMTALTNSGADAAVALDEDATSAVPLFDAGWITVDLATAQSATTFGVTFFQGTNPTRVTVATSADNLTFDDVGLIEESYQTAGEMAWCEADVVASVRYVRFTVENACSVRNLVVGGEPSQRRVTRINHDLYKRKTNPYTPGEPRQYWLDRKSDRQVMRLWPVPNGDQERQCLVVWRQRQIMDVLSMAEELELPQRWHDAVVGGLAYRIALDNPESDAGLINMLKPLADEWSYLVRQDERDAAPGRIHVNISAYTRG